MKRKGAATAVVLSVLMGTALTRSFTSIKKLILQTSCAFPDFVIY